MNIPERPSQAGLIEYLKENPSQYALEANGSIRPEDIFTPEELDVIAVESLFERLTTQEKIPDEEAIDLAHELIDAIKRVQKNLDNL